jgi:hypothetical protein
MRLREFFPVAALLGDRVIEIGAVIDHSEHVTSRRDGMLQRFSASEFAYRERLCDALAIVKPDRCLPEA